MPVASDNHTAANSRLWPLTEALLGRCALGVDDADDDEYSFKSDVMPEPLLRFSLSQAMTLRWGFGEANLRVNESDVT